MGAFLATVFGVCVIGLACVVLQRDPDDEPGDLWD